MSASATTKSVCEESEAKKLKLEASGDESPFTDGTFRSFEMERILRDDQRTKFMCLAGKIKGRDDPAIILLEKEHFSKVNLPRILSKETSLIMTLKNDIYSTFEARPPTDLVGLKSTLIYPATQKHIDKYCDYKPYIICETPLMYTTITQPCIESSNFSLQYDLDKGHKRHLPAFCARFLVSELEHSPTDTDVIGVAIVSE